MGVQPYIQPFSSEPIPNELTVTQFIQTVLVGISGVDGTLVRPKWQANPPKHPPTIETNWIAFGIGLGAPDNNAYIATNPNDPSVVDSQRHETLDVGVSIYGPLALETYALLRDGFQVPQNLQALIDANMGFVEILAARPLPDLLNERFYNRVETSIILRRQVNRLYSVPTILSANGRIYAPTSGKIDYSLAWDTQNVEN